MSRSAGDRRTEGRALHALARAVRHAPEGHYVQTYFLHQLDKSRYDGRLELFASLAKVLPDYPPLLDRLHELSAAGGCVERAETGVWVSRPDGGNISKSPCRMARGPRWSN